MELLTNKIRKSLPKLYSQENGKTGDKKVYCKFFTPDSNWSWYVLEGEQDEEDFLFYGLVVGLETEFGYFSLNELLSARGPLGMPIERDQHFHRCRLDDIGDYRKTLHHVG